MPNNLILVGENPSASASASSSSSSSSTSPAASNPQKVIRRLNVQVIFRHGDRSPITSLKDADFWSKELIPESTLREMDDRVTVISDGATSHKAEGRGPFGKLTSLGLQQMIDLGTLLRNELSTENPDGGEPRIDANGDTIYPCVWTPQRKLDAENIQVVSTSFKRAIHSATGVVMGLFPNNKNNGGEGGKITIDARHCHQDDLLPDPQPRKTQEQEALEDQLSCRPHLQAKEEEMLPLAIRVTKSLQPVLASDARAAQFGAKQVRPTTLAHNESIEVEPLGWNQLGEVTKCFSCRPGMLEALSISRDDFKAVVQHAAWRWFEIFRHPRLAYLSMNDQCTKMLEVCSNHRTSPPMILYSAHDSTLIGLLCAFKLKQPISWPEYGSFFMMELLQITDSAAGTDDLHVRFSLNGELLKLMWEEGEPTDTILLSKLVDYISNEGKATEGMGIQWDPKKA